MLRYAMLYPAAVLCVLLCVVLRPALLCSAVHAVLCMAGMSQQSIAHSMARHGATLAMPCRTTLYL